MSNLFDRESEIFLNMLSEYIDNRRNLTDVVKQCKKMNLIFLYDEEILKKMREKVFTFMKEFNEKLMDVEILIDDDIDYQKENINNKTECEQKINIDNKFIKKAAYLGLSQSIPANRAGGLPAYPLKGMLNEIEESGKSEEEHDLFEF